MTLKNQLEARLKGIGYKEGDYINFERLYKILQSLRYVYLHNTNKGYSVLIGHEHKEDFARDIKIVSIVEKPNQIWSAGVGNIMAIEVGVSP